MTDILRDFDLQPDPRILPMLGEIHLPQWRCLAELIDNAVDGFLSARATGKAVDTPQIHITVPTSDVPSAWLTVRDNGPGMAVDHLEKAVRAGWSGNSPIENLGLFGMGFNIATARLGTVTTVWTARPEDAEWHGLEIDFERLRRHNNFRTPHLTRAKSDPEEHGTEVQIQKLKPEQRAWFSRPANRTRVKKDLSRAYAAMLRPNGVPIRFALNLNGGLVRPRNHCVWDETRTTETARWGVIPAVFQIDHRLPGRPYCIDCMQWLPAHEESCSMCGSGHQVVQRKRHVHGWVGLQRYLSTNDYGMDFLRNGRKIEIGNKDLFQWRAEDGTETEYPIDDPRGRGRFVGEIHLDHCRVTHMKDRFDRTDPAWEEMLGIVRGDGPLRPEKAADAGCGPNSSPLFLLFQAFRRSTPHNSRVAGAWARVLVVKDNERAELMAQQFHDGTPEYQDDGKWWELVQEEDERLLTPPSGGSGLASTRVGLPGFSGRASPPPAAAVPATNPGLTQSVVTVLPAPPRSPLPSLTQIYRHDETHQRWDVRAYSVRANDPELDQAVPWRMTRRPTGETEFFVNQAHRVFKSATLTELDALLCELAWSAVDLMRSQPDSPSFAAVLADLRERYAGTLRLDPVALKGQTDLLLIRIARSWTPFVDTDDCLSLFRDDLSSLEQDSVYNKMAIRGVANPQEAVARGRFLEYVSARTLAEFVVKHPELFFDGRCWDDSYAEIDFPTPTATEKARFRILRQYESLLLDMVWLSEQEVEDLGLAPRERLLRAALALELLTPVTPPEEERIAPPHG